MSAGIQAGNVINTTVMTINITPVAVATITTAEQTFPLPGARIGDFVSVARPNNTPVGVGILSSRISANDTIAITFINPTAGSVTPGAGLYAVSLQRPEGQVPRTYLGD